MTLCPSTTPDRAPSEIAECAEGVLRQAPEPAVKVRLLRDVLRVPGSDTELRSASDELRRSYWVRFIAKAQDRSGNFGRLHPELRNLGILEAVGKALWVGLDPEHPVLARARQFAERVLRDGVGSSRRLVEKANCPLSRLSADSFHELALASACESLRPRSPLTKPVFDKWLRIAKEASRSGAYDRLSEKAGYEKAYGEDWPVDHCHRARPLGGLEGAAGLFSPRVELLGESLGKAYASHIWEEAPFHRLVPHAFSRAKEDWRNRVAVIRCIDTLAKLRPFRGWERMISPLLPRIWGEQGDDGMWDCGPKAQDSGFTLRLALSSDWRGPKQKQDWTTAILLLLSLYYLPVPGR